MDASLSAISHLSSISNLTADVKNNFLNASDKYFIELTINENNQKRSNKLDLALLLKNYIAYVHNTITPSSYNGPTDDNIRRSVLEALYPIGSMYISLNQIKQNPNELLGFGTWEQIKDCAIWCCSDNDTVGTSSAASIPVPEISIDFRRRSNDDPENKKDLKDRSFKVYINEQKDFENQNIDITNSSTLHKNVRGMFVTMCADKNIKDGKTLRWRSAGICTSRNANSTIYGLSCAYLKPFADMEPVINVDTGNASIYDANSTVAKPTCINAYAWRRTA